MVHNIRITFGAHTQPQIEIQQGDYNSRTIRARCYTSSGVLMEFEGETVSVVYEISGKISEEYPVEVLENVLTFTMPGISSASAGSGKLQLRIYGEKSLLHSAIIPYTVKASLDPGPAEEDQVPMLVLLVQQAQEAIDGANAASKRANDVANDVQGKLDSGAFIGPPGLDAPQIDDTQITTTNPWSSMQIVNTLCPPFTVSGATVQCTPVANYPLGVQVEITPTQEGTGDPSPENVRPIVGWDGVNVWRSGKNLLDWSKVSAFAYPAYGLSFEKKENSIRVFGVSTENGVLSFNIATTTQSELRGKNFVFSWFTSEENVTGVYGLRTPGEAEIAISANLTEGSSYDFTIQIAVGTEKLTAYEPYQGQAYTVQLGQTVYGGTLDVGTGEGSDEWAFVEFDGSEDEQWRKQVHSSGRVCFLIDITPYGLILDPTQVTWKCNRLVPFVYNYSAIEYPEYSIGFMSLKNTCAIVLENESMLSVDEVKAWLAENPVTVCYKLATPEPFQATGSQPIPALPGTNTVYTDAGNITVTGASDPIATITALQNRVSALESAALN